MTCIDESWQYIWMSHSRSLVAILVAMQWANEDVFNSGSDIL